jgi:hypothetical protein
VNQLEAHTWVGNWVWGLPLIVLTFVIHVYALAFIGEGVMLGRHDKIRDRKFMHRLAFVMSLTSVLVTTVHGFEAAVWAVAYRMLGALPDIKTAMLYSFGAMTTYGHAGLYLTHDYQLMGTFEALNGMLLFGLTTAFLFAMIQRIWPLGGKITLP